MRQNRFLADAPPWGTALMFTVIENIFGSGAGRGTSEYPFASRTSRADRDSCRDIARRIDMLQAVIYNLYWGDSVQDWSTSVDLNLPWNF